MSASVRVSALGAFDRLRKLSYVRFVSTREIEDFDRCEAGSSCNFIHIAINSGPFCRVER